MRRKRRKFDQRKERTTWRYQVERRRFLAANPLCAECDRNGIVMPAAELDHIVPASKAPERFWDQENWQGLCVECHLAKTAKENRQETDEMAEWREYIESRQRRPGWA